MRGIPTPRPTPRPMPSWGLFSLVLAFQASVPAADSSAGSAIDAWVDVGVVGAWDLESS
jgi:hypothetical protein